MESLFIGKRAEYLYNEFNQVSSCQLRFDFKLITKCFGEATRGKAGVAKTPEQYD